MDWFERLTGFAETSYRETQARLDVEGSELVSRVSGQRHGVGELELVSLRQLRNRARQLPDRSGRLHVQIAQGDVRQLHRRPAYANALFQVASQFNLLEMTGPAVRPEDGVTRYAHDPTQGPACAIAAGAATVYRNYFARVGDQIGQTHDRQLDALADVGDALADATGMPRAKLWAMQNGYALCGQEGLAAIDRHLRAVGEAGRDDLRSRLRIGMHWNVEVTDAPGPDRPSVSQAFCAALPVAYTAIPAAAWQPFAELVLEAAYEATLLAGLLHRARGGTNIVLLTRLGGGAFGNEDQWIDRAMKRALGHARNDDLDVRIVSYSEPSASTRALVEALS